MCFIYCLFLLYIPHIIYSYDIAPQLLTIILEEMKLMFYVNVPNPQNVFLY